MRKIIAAIFLLPWAVKAINHAFSSVTSSRFAMVLSPTLDRLDVETSTLVENTIKLSLLSSSSSSSNFESLFDIDIVLQQVEWTDGTTEGQTGSGPFTSLRFEAHAKFHEDPLNASPPTQFALDSLVVRTFSQPSSKSGFLDALDGLQAPVLDTIGDVEIAIDDTIAESEDESQNESLSLLDILLISASGIVLIGIIYIMCQHHNDQIGLQDQQLRSLHEWQRKRKASASSQGTDEGAPAEVSNLQETGLPTNRDFCDQSVEDDDIEPSPECPSMVHENIAYKGGSTEEEVDDDSAIEHYPTPNDSDASSSSSATPPISNASSANSSPIGRASSMGSSCLSVLSSGDISNTGSPYRLGVPPPLYPMGDESSSVASSEASPLTARLLRLPMIDSPGSDTRSITSPASAPAVLMGDTGKSSKEIQLKSTDSISRSTGSDQDLSRSSTPTIPVSDSRESNTDITDLAVASCCHTLLSEKQTFENDWDLAKRRAIEDDGSVEDVFCVDVDAHSSVEDVRSRMSGLSAVSEWLKSVRVVGSPASRTSDTSHTSAEHSSVEPKSIQMRDATSIDCSLERSLAASLTASMTGV